MQTDRVRFIPRLIARRPLIVVVAALVLAGLGIQQALTLKIDTDIATLLPPEYDSVQSLRKLQETVGAETTVDVAIYSPSFDANRTFAEAFVPRMMALDTPAGRSTSPASSSSATCGLSPRTRSTSPPSTS